MEVMPIPNKTIIENKSSVYAGVVRDLNDARGRSLPFNVSFELLRPDLKCQPFARHV
jgi:hypothetical protein